MRLWVRELNDAALNLIALVHQEYVASGKLGPPNDHGISGGADDSHIGLSLQAYFTTCEVQIARSLTAISSLILSAMPWLGADSAPD